MLRLILVVGVLLTALTYPRPAYAYLDATSGSILLQLLLGGVAGMLVVLKLFWRMITGTLGMGKRHDDHELQP